MVNNLFRILCFFLLLFSCTSKDGHQNDHADKLAHQLKWKDKAITTYLQNHVKRFMDIYGCPGLTVVAMQDHELLLHHSYGRRNILEPDSVDMHTLYRLGSVSKGFTGILSAVLIDKGYFTLDDPVTDFFSECRIRAKSEDGILRVRHLLTHASGLTEHAYTNLVDENHPRELLYDYILTLQPRDSTGIHYAYQNVAFGLMEGIIEKTSGMSFNQALDRFIFSPLEMCESSCTYYEFMSSDNRCTGHVCQGNAQFASTPVKPNYYNLVSAGGVNSTGADMKIWLEALLGAYPEVIGPNALRMAFTPYVSTMRDDRYFNIWPDVVESYYGLGWRIIKTPNRTLLYHGGMVNNFRTEIGIDPESRVGVVFLFNAICDYSNEAIFRFFDEWDCYQYSQKQ